MPAYFDHNASSPLNDDVLQAMLPYLTQIHANPSSLHQSGRLARGAIETARQQVAQAVGCNDQQVLFTSGGTEANNTVLHAHQHLPFYIGSVEHASVLDAAQHLKSVHLIPVDEHGVYRFKQLVSEPIFVSVQMVNNETGVIQTIETLRQYYPEALIHCDASQAVGKINVDFKTLEVDFLTLSAHKFNGPKGVGALIMKQPSAFNALLKGGLQEHKLRAGTENVAAIVGMGLAAQLAQSQLSKRQQHGAELRNYFEQRLEQMASVVIFAQHAKRVSNTSFFALPYFHGETFLMECDRAGFELASGSACHSSVTTSSHVLQAMQVDDGLALNAVRASFGVDNTRQQIDEFINFIQAKLENLPASIKCAMGMK